MGLVGGQPLGSICRPSEVALPQPIYALGIQTNAAFEASGQSCGSRRLSAVLREQGLAVRRHRARTLVRSNGLRTRWRHTFVHTTDSRHALPVAANVLAHQVNET